MRPWMRMAIVMLLLASSAAAQDVVRQSGGTAQTPRAEKPKITGPRGKAPIIGSVYIGELAPDFWLDASTGGQVKLSNLRGVWVLLVFGDRYRKLAAYDSLDLQAHPLGARVVGICHEKQYTLTGALARKEFQLLLMGDPTGEVSAMYGVYDWVHSTTETGLFVLDPKGVVRLAIIGQLFPPDQLLDLIKFATTMGSP